MIEFRDHTVYRGPNIWARMPSLRFTVDIGELEDRPTNKIPGFYERLTELIPSLYDHRLLVGRPGGFLQRMREGTWMGHVLEHRRPRIAKSRRGRSRRGQNALDRRTRRLQRRLRASAGRCRDRRGGVGQRLLNHLIYDSEPDFDFQSELESTVIRTAERLAYGPSTGAIVSEAERRNIPVIRLDPRRSLVQLGHGVHQKRVWATVTSETSNIAVDIAGNKELTNQLLHEVGIPVPRSVTCAQ